jgi:hypothetical protein
MDLPGVVPVVAIVLATLAGCGGSSDVPRSVTPPGPDGIVTSRGPAPPGAFAFAGWHWTTKVSPSPVGPDPNRFAGADTGNVEVDAHGRLHLRITRRAGQWLCAEVIGTEALGYGTYTWEVEAPATPIEPNAVLGLFAWSDLPEQNHREIDIELSHFRRPNADLAGQYVVQPFGGPGDLQQFKWANRGDAVSVSFTWRAGEVTFDAPAGNPATWRYAAANVPDPGGGVHPRMNLWLLGGEDPARNTPTEVVIRRFTFVPLTAA